MNDRILKVGITGGIGSGKSYVSRLLEQQGMPVYDSDSAAKQLMLVHPSIREELISLLGEDVYRDGRLNKPLIASYLFSSAEHAAHINAIVHPKVRDDFAMWAQNQDKTLVGMECAILFEAGFSDAVDFIVSVSAPLDVRIRRTMQRDHAPEPLVRQRIAAQMSDEEKQNLSDFVIVNDGVRPLQPQIDALLEIVKSRKPE